ncbi:MAG: hypothetical protein ACYS8W_20770 [Planctomycetota bacterium]
MADIVAVGDKGCIVTGWTDENSVFDPGGPNETNVTAIDDSVFIARYDSDGSFLWVKKVRSDDDSNPRAISVFPNGSFVITGEFDEPSTFGPGEANEITLMPLNDYDTFFIARYNADGTLAWVKTAENDPIAQAIMDSDGNYSASFGFAVQTTPDGEIYVAGAYEYHIVLGQGEANETQYTTFGTPGDEISECFIARYTGDGSLIWCKRVVNLYPDGGGNQNADYCRSQGLALFSDGSVALLGMFYDLAMIGEGDPNVTLLDDTDDAGETDMFLARYNPDGSLVWATNFGTDGWDHARSLTVAPDDTIFTLNYFYSYGDGYAYFSENTPFEYSYDIGTTIDDAYLIAQFTPDGVPVTAKLVDSYYNFECRRNAITATNDNVYITGWWSGDITVGTGETNEANFTSRNGNNDILIGCFKR